MRLRCFGAGFLLAGLSLACSSDPAKPPPNTQPLLRFADVFHQPLAFCSRNAAGADTLGLYNQGDTTVVVWVTGPEWVEGLVDSVSIPPDYIANLPFRWKGQTPPRNDMIVMESGGEAVEVPIRLLGLGTAEPVPPAPLLATPADRARFTVGEFIPVWWSRTDNCDLGAQYRLQISPDSTFATEHLSLDESLTDNVASIEVQAGDEGTAYWRVRSTNAAGTSTSEVRTWKVLPLSTPGPK